MNSILQNGKTRVENQTKIQVPEDSSQEDGINMKELNIQFSMSASKSND